VLLRTGAQAPAAARSEASAAPARDS
jgi:hypothetical protein